METNLPVQTLVFRYTFYPGSASSFLYIPQIELLPNDPTNSINPSLAGARDGELAAAERAVSRSPCSAARLRINGRGHK